jgi:hypothetical protein
LFVPQQVTAHPADDKAKIEPCFGTASEEGRKRPQIFADFYDGADYKRPKTKNRKPTNREQKPDLALEPPVRHPRARRIFVKGVVQVTHGLPGSLVWHGRYCPGNNITMYYIGK